MVDTLPFLFETSKLTQNADPYKQLHSRYGIGFDSCSLFFISNFDLGKNVIFGVDNGSLQHTNNIKKYIFVLGNGPTQQLDDTTITVGVILLILLCQKINFA